MNTGLNQETATIYQFPVGGRSAVGQHGEPTNTADLATRVSEIVCGSAWYHEAAIQESKPVREQ
ncbi:MAG TPA: DUF2735 domain-containing protein [Caulobacteraceae bacterium]|jgi:hypothetical protein|nr:DUF2735 domain-containing protein [Caulobacteraceae bacterium]